MINFRDKKLPLDKDLSVSLNTIRGISWFHSNFLKYKLGLSRNYPLKYINSYYSSLIKNYLNNFLLTSIKIEEAIQRNIVLLKDINCYKGIRHGESLPVHGQRTRSNAGTQRSKKVIQVISLNPRPEGKKKKK